MGTREAVLAALRAAGATATSGESLADSLGVSRVAVSKHVSSLRALGYVIEASPATGYRLVSAPDAALPTEVAPLLADPLWTRVEGAEETGSTNDDARVLARRGAPEGTLVVAARQTAGKGRLGRAWVSPPGGAYLSAVLRPPVAPAEAGPLALVVAVGAARGLETLGVRAEFKWPNDLLLEGGKLAGILLEMAAEGDLVEWIVAGIGVNVRRPVRAEPRAVYVSDVAQDARVADVAAAALDGVAQAYREWLRGGFGPMVAEYEARSALTGTQVTVRDALGTVRAAGTVAGVDAEGRLLVDGESGTQAVSSGEVTLREQE